MLNLSNKNFKIVEKFKFLICISLAVLVVGIVMMAIKGMNIGIDFKGGAKVEIEMTVNGNDDEVRTQVKNVINKHIVEKGYKLSGDLQETRGGSTRTFEASIPYPDKGTEADFMASIQGDINDDTNNGICGDIQTELEALCAEGGALFGKATIEENGVKGYTVGATASSTLLKNAIIALSVAIVVMLIYIIIRFKFASALAAVCALCHDVLLMIALTTIFQIPVNSTFIAAVITIIGYSINATIVIFDCIREQTKLESNKDLTDADIANKAIAKTLGRTILTTVTTLLMVIFLAIFSVPAIREFVLPIIFGLIAGTFSSVCLACSFWAMFRKVGSKIKAKKQMKAKTAK